MHFHIQRTTYDVNKEMNFYFHENRNSFLLREIGRNTASSMAFLSVYYKFFDGPIRFHNEYFRGKTNFKSKFDDKNALMQSIMQFEHMFLYSYDSYSSEEYSLMNVRFSSGYNNLEGYSYLYRYGIRLKGFDILNYSKFYMFFPFYSSKNDLLRFVKMEINPIISKHWAKKEIESIKKKLKE